MLKKENDKINKQQQITKYWQNSIDIILKNKLDCNRVPEYLTKQHTISFITSDSNL